MHEIKWIGEELMSRYEIRWSDNKWVEKFGHALVVERRWRKPPRATEVVRVNDLAGNKVWAHASTLYSLKSGEIVGLPVSGLQRVMTRARDREIERIRTWERELLAAARAAEREREERRVWQTLTLAELPTATTRGRWVRRLKAWLCEVVA